MNSWARSQANGITVLLVEENALFRRGLRVVLAEEEDIAVVGEASTVEGALSSIKQLNPNVVILNTELPAPGGLELVSRMRRHCPAIGVITLALDEDDEEVYQAIKAGSAAHFATKVSAAELAAAVRKVSQGEYPINEYLLSKPKVASRVLNQFQTFSLSAGKEFNKLVVPLSSREIEILEYIAHGNSNKQIANVLNIKEQSVKSYVSGILRKLAANDRAHAVFMALKHGWLKT